MKYLLIFIPVLMTMSLALRDQYNRKKNIGTTTLSITSILVVIRFSILAYVFDNGQRTMLLNAAELISSMYIMPFTYMFLCDQCGTRWNNREAIFMSSLPVLSLLALIPALSHIGFHNWVITFQCIIICYCMIRLRKRIICYQLLFTHHIKVYFTWMAVLLFVTILTSLLNFDKSNHEWVKTLYFSGYSIIISIGYLSIPYSFRIYKRNKCEETRSIDLDNQISINAPLSMALHKLMEEDLYYLQPDTNIDDVATRLGTNRTYVTRLMRQEYGLTFIEYVNAARIQYSQKLLYTSPNITLDEVAIKSGFQSTSNYCRAFKRYTGATPKGWLQEAHH